MLIKQAVDFLYLCPPMMCAVNWALNSLKVLTGLGVSRLNQILAAPFSVIGKALHMISSATPEGASMSWRSLGGLEGPWPRRSYLCATCKTCAARGKSWRRQWTGNQCDWRDRQDYWIPVLWERSSSPPFASSSPVSLWKQGVESCPRGIGCLHFVAPVGLGRYFLPVLRGLAGQHWNLPGLLQYYCLPSNVAALPNLILPGEALDDRSQDLHLLL